MARVMPSNKEAEMSVLGICFIDNSLVSEICDEVTEDMFYDERNKLLFLAIKELNNKSIPIDINMIKDELDKSKNLNKIGGIAYISEVIDSVITTSNLSYYIEILKEHFIRRNLINSANEVINDAFDENNLSEVLDTAERKILEVAESRTVKDFVPIGEILRRAQEKLEELAKNKRPVTGLETGFYELDKVTTGFQPTELIILAARPSVGKTALALNMAMYAATTTDKAVAIFNMEMTSEQLITRIIASLGGIDSYKLQTGNMQERDWKRFNEAMNEIANTNLIIEDNIGLTLGEIRAKCRRLAASPKGLALVVIDYLQIVNSGNKRAESRQAEVAEISRSLKHMATELRIPVIALSQLNRQSEKGGVPGLADLRESGQIEQDADIIMFIDRETNKKDNLSSKEDIVPADLRIAKHRKGSLRTIPLLFEKSKGAFRNVAKNIEEE